MREKTTGKNVEAGRAGENDSGDGQSRGREWRNESHESETNERGTVV
jgi:hypothetical protein